MFISHSYIMARKDVALTGNGVRDATHGGGLTQAQTHCLMEGFRVGDGGDYTDNGVCQISVMKETKNQQSTKTP